MANPTSTPVCGGGFARLEDDHSAISNPGHPVSDDQKGMPMQDTLTGGGAASGRTPRH
jgi:hypothetical protein